MRVLDEDAEGLIGTRVKQDVPQQRERFGFDAARGRIRGHDIRQSEHGTQQGHRVLRLACVVEQPNEMPPPQGRRIIMAEASDALDVAQHWIERAVGMIG